MLETQVWSMSWEDPMEKQMATHSSILFFFNIYILLKYSWPAVFQVQSKVIQLNAYTYIIFGIIFHYRLL